MFAYLQNCILLEVRHSPILANVRYSVWMLTNPCTLLRSLYLPNDCVEYIKRTKATIRTPNNRIVIVITIMEQNIMRYIEYDKK